MTVPPPHEEQSHLDAGSRLAIEIVGDELKVRPDHPRRPLAELLAATPPSPCRAGGLGSPGPISTKSIADYDHSTLA